MLKPAYPPKLPRVFVNNELAPGMEWIQHAGAFVYQCGLPVWMDGQYLWGVIGGEWQLLPNTTEYRTYYIGRQNFLGLSREARTDLRRKSGGLYALIGPTIQGNPYEVDRHLLVAQFTVTAHGVPITAADVEEYFGKYPIYGLAWKGTRGRVAVATREQFGYDWPDEELLAMMRTGLMQ